MASRESVGARVPADVGRRGLVFDSLVSLKTEKVPQVGRLWRADVRVRIGQSPKIFLITIWYDIQLGNLYKSTIAHSADVMSWATNFFSGMHLQCFGISARLVDLEQYVRGVSGPGWQVTGTFAIPERLRSILDEAPVAWRIFYQGNQQVYASATTMAVKLRAVNKIIALNFVVAGEVTVELSDLGRFIPKRSGQIGWLATCPVESQDKGSTVPVKLLFDKLAIACLAVSY